ncbi:azurin [Pseudomonas sp. LRF_L74]|uniref:azurin n=1 Tax=Pseudomonas sp. LRF_L74 TaxID=3369422 RepID=UPI003F62008E
MNRQMFLFAVLALSTVSAWAADNCATEIHGTDQMTFDKTSIEIPKTCSTFTVTLSHPGSMPKSVMGHNWVLTKTEDMQAVIDDGQKVGEEKDYLKPQDERVIAHTRLLGGGETDSVTIKTNDLKTGTPYSFFCSFPFHATLMKGTLTLGS